MSVQAWTVLVQCGTLVLQACALGFLLRSLRLNRKTLRVLEEREERRKP